LEQIKDNILIFPQSSGTQDFQKSNPGPIFGSYPKTLMVSTCKGLGKWLKKTFSPVTDADILDLSSKNAKQT
jgi:hypothetical protein